MATLALSVACGGEVTSVGGNETEVVTAVETNNATVEFGHMPPATVALAALVVGTAISTPTVTWSLAPGAEGCGSLGATISQAGLFTAPTSASSVGSTCRVVATAVADSTKSGVSDVTITAAAAPSSVLAAFPGAQGGGALSKGGRGGAVIEVTNLNDSGTGSLRACVEGSGPRTCVFRVSGVINLASQMHVRSSYLTVAGQTAPGDGVAVNLATHLGNQRVFNVDSGVHDLVIRYLRIWGDYVTNQDPSRNTGTFGVMIWGESRDIIFDHCEFLWHSGEGFGIWASSGTAATNGRVTLQWSIVGENVLSPGPGTPQSTAILTADGSYNGTNLPDVDFHHNLMVSADHRMPNLNGSGRFVNNVIYNWLRAAMVDSGGGQSTYDFIGNHWKVGPMTPYTNYREVMFTRGVASIYMANNKSEWNLAGRGPVSETEPEGGWSLLTGTSSVYQGSVQAAPAAGAYQRSPWGRLPSPGVDITPEVVSGQSLLNSLTSAGAVGASRRLDCSGSWVTVSNSARDRILAYVKAGTGPSAPPSSQTGLGPLPTLASGVACADADHDGMPDAYEAAKCGSATCLDPNTAQADRYTNLEHYLNGN